MIPFQLRTLLTVLSTPGVLEEPGLSSIWRRLALVLGFVPLEAANAAALALDEPLFDYAKVEVRAPVFIVGPPRSGTTFLFHLLARDRQFTAFQLWQILAPSLSVQKLVRGLAAVDRKLGAPLRRRLDAAQDRRLGWMDGFHALRLNQPEEDEFLLVHAFASEMLAVPYPVPAAFAEYRHFDTLPADRRRRLMAYYRGCVQRHLVGDDRRFLSKSPAFSGKVGSLHETFPDARFILLVRHPAATMSSLASMVDQLRAPMGLTSDAGWAENRAEMLRYLADCYRSALDAIDRLPEGQGLIVRYEDLAAAPGRTVRDIYRRIGATVDPAFAAVLEAADARAKHYRSGHAHDLTKSGLTEAQVEAAAGFVYDRFGYARNEERS